MVTFLLWVNLVLWIAVGVISLVLLKAERKYNAANSDKITEKN